LNLTVDGQFSVWYASAAAQAFGSLFTAAVTFAVHGNVDAVQSMSVTVNNSLGASNSASVTLR